MKDYNYTLPGFTVLEFLIVIAMMVLLMGAVLMGLSNSRAHTRDQVRISNVKKIEIGLAQYYQVCGSYPQYLYASFGSYATCPALSNQGKSIKDFIPDIDTFDFNPSNTLAVNIGYKYAPLTYVAANTNCTGYHIGVALEESNNSMAVKDSQFDSTVPSIFICGGSSATYPFNGNQSTGTATNPIVFDRVVNY